MNAPSAIQDDCILCGTGGTVLYPQLRDRYFDTSGVFSLVECPSCRLVWLHPKPAHGDVAEHYEEYYTHEAPDGDSWLHRMVKVAIPAAAFGYDDHPLSRWDRVLARVLALFGPLRELAQHSVMWLPGSQRGRVLDFGCGSGDLLANFQQLGWQIAGVEPDPGGAAQTRRRLGVEEIYTDLRDPALADDSFDAVTFSHVFEHLLEPQEALRDCLRVLEPGGQLILTTPNVDSLGRRYFGEAWNHWDPPRHIYLFSKQALIRMITDCGFEIDSVSTPSSTSHFVFQISKHIRDRKKLPGITLENVSAFTKISSVIFWAAEHILTLAGRERGEELLIVARKPVAKSDAG